MSVGSSSEPRTVTARAAVAGMTAGALALGTSELVAGLLPGAASLVVAVADAVIDLAPPAAVDLAVDTFGTGDKAALIAGLLVVGAGMGAVLGVLGRHRPRARAAAFAGFALVGVAAASGQPATPLVPALFSAAVSAAVGMSALGALLRVARGEPAFGPRGMPAPGSEATAVVSRRAFLAVTGATFALAAASAAGGRLLLRGARAAAARARVVLPRPALPAASIPASASLEVPGISPLVTPNARFYRIDTALVVPDVDLASWRLAVDGMVDQPFELTFDELLALPLVEADVTLACVSNPVGGPLVGTARWLGVPLSDLLDRAGVRAGADQVVGRSVDGFTAGFPTSVALDGRTALVAVGMNGEPLPLTHGFPARLVVAGLYGYVSATKWLRRIELTTLAGFDAYWIPRGWAKEAPIKTQCRIDVPRPYRRIAPGPTQVAGVAWAPTRGVSAVEVQVDDGPWAQARLAAPINHDTWRQWVYDWEATPGTHVVQARAVDTDGRLQESQRALPRPDGATGYHAVQVRVTRP